ncbi:MAG: HTH-type transcriptional regulator YofA [Enterocloster aldenensis]
MDERDFELIRILGDTENITRAADELYTTQSALSKRIKAIERELGFELFLRSRQGLRFTPAGEEVLRYSRTVTVAMEQMRHNLEMINGQVCGTLNAGISINYALYTLPDKLAEYHRLYPLVKLHITTGQSRHLYRQLLEGNQDMVILRGEYNWDGARYLLGQERICVVCSEEHRNQPLKDYLYISHKSDMAMEAQTAQWMRENKMSFPASDFCVDDLGTCLAMVQQGIGWAILPEIALAGFDGVVQPLYFENGEPFVRRTHILCHKDAVELPQVDAFIKLLRSKKR